MPRWNSLEIRSEACDCRLLSLLTCPSCRWTRLIVQVVANLVDNALKYSSVDAPIEIDAGVNCGQLQIRVADHGRGIQKQELDRVFEKFFRGTSSGGPRGAGLGLSICKGFVTAHGGLIWASSRPEEGTEVVFLLPMSGKCVNDTTLRVARGPNATYPVMAAHLNRRW